MIVLVPLTLIDDNPFQTRSLYDPAAIQELADSIAGLREARFETCGLIHVPPARPVDGLDGTVVGAWTALANGEESMRTYRYQLAAGHCRFRAFQLLAGADGDDWGVMPLDLVELDDRTMADVAWAENQKRKDLTAVEQARTIQTAMERFDWTQAEVAARWGLSRPAVANKLRLLNLPGEVQERVVTREIGERTARALLPALDVEDAFQGGVEAIEQGKPASDVEWEVTWRLKRHSADLGDAPFPAEWPGPRHGLELPPCQGCEQRRKVAGDWRCFDGGCLKQKKSAWNEAQVTRAMLAMQEKVGQPLVAYEEDSYSLVSFTGEDEQAVFEQTCKPACKHGRLGLLGNVSNYTRREGVKADAGEAWFVCDKRRCMTALRSKSPVQDSTRKRKAAEKKARQAVKDAIVAFHAALDDDQAPALGGYAPLREYLLDRAWRAIPDNGLRTWAAKIVEGTALDDESAFWRAMATAWLARTADYIWQGSDIPDELGAEVDALWLYLAEHRGNVSGETS